VPCRRHGPQQSALPAAKAGHSHRTRNAPARLKTRELVTVWFQPLVVVGCRGTRGQTRRDVASEPGCSQRCDSKSDGQPPSGRKEDAGVASDRREGAGRVPSECSATQVPAVLVMETHRRIGLSTIRRSHTALLDQGRLPRLVRPQDLLRRTADLGTQQVRRLASSKNLNGEW
jgi:hypothetical protein